MSELMIAVLNTISNFAQKSHVAKLTEYEVLMYEQLSNFTATWAKCNELAARHNWYDMEMQVEEKRKIYEKWLEGDNESDSSTCNSD